MNPREREAAKRRVRRYLELAREEPDIVGLRGVVASSRRRGAGGGGGTILWNGDFQTNDTSQYYSVQQKAAGRVTTIASPVGDGKFWDRTQVNYLDYLGSDPAAERAIANVGTVNADGSQGKDQWWSWSHLFPNGTTGGYPAGDVYHIVTTSIPRWNIPIQFQHTTTQTGTGGSFVGQAMFNFCIDMTSSSVPTYALDHFYGDQDAPTKATYTFDAAFALATRYDFVFHVFWSNTSTLGGFEVWMKKGAAAATKVRAWVSIPTLYATSSGTNLTAEQTWPDIGLYRQGTSARNNTDVVYHTGFCRGDSYSAVIGKFLAASWPGTPP